MFCRYNASCRYEYVYMLKCPNINYMSIQAGKNSAAEDAREGDVSAAESAARQ